MAVTLYIALILLGVTLCLEGLRDQARIYQFPFGAAVVFLGFIGVPLFSLVWASFLPEGAVERYLALCLLCLSMCWVGDACARHAGGSRREGPVYDVRRWLAGATFLIVLGGLAYARFRAMFQQGYDTNTGVTVAMQFLVYLMRYGFIMAVLCFLHTRSRYALLLLCLVGVYYLDRIVLFGRRQEALELIFVIAGSLWVVMRKTVPRAVVLTGILGVSVLLGSVHAYRLAVVSTTGQRDWSQMRDLSVVEEFQKTNAEGSTETLAGVYLTAATACERQFDFGLYHWNMLVFNFVPAQVVGDALKQSLYLPITDPTDAAERRFGFTPSVGTTVTGMVDCYASFWYLGCLKFFVIAYAMQALYRQAIEGRLAAQAFYVFMMTQALHTITHGTHWFLSAWVHIAVFWMPIVWFSKGRVAWTWGPGASLIGSSCRVMDEQRT